MITLFVLISGALALVLCGLAGLLFVQVLAHALEARQSSSRVAPMRADSPRPALVVLVPAHNEAAGIATTLASVRSQLQSSDRLLVVADNCTDDTALVARAHGAEVTERQNEHLRGKGYALAHGLATLQQTPPSLVIIIDADCRIDAGAIDALAETVQRTGRPVQALYLMTAPTGAALSRRLNEFTWRLRNWIRPSGAARLGQPCQLMGTGMAFTWPMLQQVRLDNGSIVEDMKLGLDLACQGLAPVFCVSAIVRSEFPDAQAAAKTQRVRWEHGHLGMIAEELPTLLRTALVRRDGRLFAMAMDLAIPPLGLLAGLLAAGSLICAALAAGLGATFWPAWAQGAGLLSMVCSVAIGWYVRGRDLVRFKELLTIPWFLLLKVPLYASFLFKRQKSWIRTGRGNETSAAKNEDQP